jgi:hypothetical protein
MIKKINMFYDARRSFNNLHDIEQFSQIFSNIEQLICCIDQADQLLFLLKHLRKLSYGQLFGSIFNDSEHCSS